MCRRLTATSQFQSYIQNLDHYFFDAIGNVTRLAIIGHENGLIGQMFHGTLVPLKRTHVSKLKELELGYYIIQDNLLDFLIAHSSTLEVRKLLVVSTVSVWRVSIVEFPLCCLFRHEHLAKSATASNIQRQLSRLQSGVMEILVSHVRL